MNYKQLESLTEKKGELEMELKEINKSIKKLKLRRSLNSASKLIRVSGKFNETLEKINEKRENLALEKITNPKICELIIRHISWSKIKEDIINFNVNVENNGGITQNAII